MEAISTVIDKALQAAGVAISGTSGPFAAEGDTSNATSSWHFRTSSSQWLRVDWPSVPTAQQVSAADSVVQATDSRPRTTRTVLAIYNDLVALTSTQKQNIWAFLTGTNPVASPPPITQDTGSGSVEIFALWRRVVNETGLSAAVLTDIKTQAAAIYAWDIPRAFVQPSWDSTINVAGDAPQ